MAKPIYQRKKYLFISSETTGLDVVINKHTANEKLVRLRFDNCIYTCDDEAIAEAIRSHPHFGWRFFEDNKDRKIENAFTPEKQELADALSGMSIQMLRNIAKEQRLMDGNWKKITSTDKKELVSYMVRHKDNLGHYATLGH